MLISIFLRPFTLLSKRLRYQEWPHFLVNLIEFSVKFFDPLNSFHGEPTVPVGHRMGKVQLSAGPSFTYFRIESQECDCR